MKYLILLFGCLSCLAQPALPKMDRQVIWVQPNPTNVAGYILQWGTNRIDISGVSNTTATIKLDEGVNTIVLRAAGTNGLTSEPITNITRLISYEFQESTNGGTIWTTLTNFTYAISNYKTSAMFRARLNWIKP